MAQSTAATTSESVKAPSKNRALLDSLGLEQLSVRIPVALNDALNAYAKRDYAGNMPKLVKLLLVDAVNTAALTNDDGSAITIERDAFLATTRTRTNKAKMTPEERAAHEAQRKLNTKYEAWFGRRLLENFKAKQRDAKAILKPEYTFDEWVANVANAKPTASPDVKADAKGNIVAK